MNSKNKKIILITLPLFLVIIIAGIFLIPLISTFFRIKYYEKNWGIDLPGKIRQEYITKATHIDGSAEYIVFSVKQEPEKLFSEVYQNITKTSFEKWVAAAISGLTASSGKSKIAENYYPDFNTDYEYICLQDNRTTRIAYLYIIYYPDTMKIILLQDIRQYAHSE